jgi:hypothetical protein
VRGVGPRTLPRVSDGDAYLWHLRLRCPQKGVRDHSSLRYCATAATADAAAAVRTVGRRCGWRCCDYKTEALPGN